MGGLRSILARFPEHEFAIYRACVRNETFRAVCADLEIAVSAMRRFEEAGDPRVEEYRTLTRGIEEELLERLGSPADPPAGSSR